MRLIYYDAGKLTTDDAHSVILDHDPNLPHFVVRRVNRESKIAIHPDWAKDERSLKNAVQKAFAKDVVDLSLFAFPPQ